MWPRLLLEFLPHLTRLVPAADTYFNSRKRTDEALQAALASLGDEVRSGFANAAEVQSARDRELRTHIAALKEVTASLADVRAGMDRAEARLSTVEEHLLSIKRLLWAVLAVLLCGIAVLTLRVWH